MEPKTETRKRHAGMSMLLGRLMRRLSLAKKTEAQPLAWQPEASRFVLETLDPLILLSGDPITASVPLGFQASAAADLPIRLLDVNGVKSVRIEGSDNGEAVSKTQALADLVGVGVSITGSSGSVSPRRRAGDSTNRTTRSSCITRDVCGPCASSTRTARVERSRCSPVTSG